MVLIIVQSSVQGNSDEGHWPHTVRRVDKELASQTRQTVTNEIGCEGIEKHVCEVASILLIEILRQNLSPDDVVGVRGGTRGVCHDGNEHVLLFVEATGVQVDNRLGKRDTNVFLWHPFLPGLAQGEGKELGDIGVKANCGLTDTEQLIDEGKKGAEYNTNSPSTNGGHGNGRVIVVVDNSTNLSVRAVVGDEGRLELHLLDESLMLLWVF